MFCPETSTTPAQTTDCDADILYLGRSSPWAETSCPPTLWVGRECSLKWSRMLFWPKRRQEPAIARLLHLLHPHILLLSPCCQLCPQRLISHPAASKSQTPGLSPCCCRPRTEPGRAPRVMSCSRTVKMMQRARRRPDSRGPLAVSELAPMYTSPGDHCDKSRPKNTCAAAHRSNDRWSWCQRQPTDVTFTDRKTYRQDSVCAAAAGTGGDGTENCSSENVRLPHNMVSVEICLQPALLTDSWLLTDPAAPTGGAVSHGSQDTQRQHYVMTLWWSCRPLLVEEKAAAGPRTAGLQGNVSYLLSGVVAGKYVNMPHLVQFCGTCTCLNFMLLFLHTSGTPSRYTSESATCLKTKTITLIQ